MTNLIFTLSLLTLASSLSSPLSDTKAYLDPGSGSFIIQLLVASLLGGLFIVKTYWKKITTFFRDRFSKRRGDLDE